MKTCSSILTSLPAWAVAVSSMALATSAFGQVTLYNNQGIGDNPALSTGATTESGVAAPAGYTWSEVQHNAGNLTEANTVAGFADNLNSGAPGPFHMADDFTIPAGQTWNITSIWTYGYKTSAPATPSPFDEVRLQIWNGPPNGGGAVIFGDVVANRLVGSTDALLYRIFNTAVPPPGTLQGTTRKIWRNDVSTLSGFGAPLTLGPGTYWVQWTVSDTANGTHFAPNATIAGTRGLAGWNALQLQLITWVPAIDAGNPAAAPDVPQDMPFIVRGTQATPPCLPDINGDGQVNINDLLAVINGWGPCPLPCPPYCAADVNDDCAVNINDLLAVINGWGPCPP